MKHFMTLVAFEYKKIFKRKSVRIMSLVVLFVSMIICVGTLIGNVYVEGEIYASKYDEMMKDKAFAIQLAGRQIDEHLIAELVETRKQVDLKDIKHGSIEYEKYIQPYRHIWYIIRGFYRDEAANLTEAQIKDFYSIRDAIMEEDIEMLPIEKEAKEELLKLNAQIQKPFVFDYIEGHRRYLIIMYLIGIMASFLGAIWCAPMFAGERAKKTDQIILATKEGKKKLIGAKIFAGLSLSGLATLILMLITYIECMIVFGVNGFDVQWQICMPNSPYPLTVGQVVIISSICIFCANLYSSSIILWLSARLKKPFTVLMVSAIMIIVPMMIGVPQSMIHVYKMIQLLPSNMMDIWRMMNIGVYELFNIYIPPYILFPIFAVGATVVFVLLATRSAKRHQIH